ncbi:signal peptidase I [Salibacterium halotolerans]|uniref:Signal peptidase I n=1 Tax=Salibacterium halotolerans TaxID=1884432 RepID=A0A1I5V678_9BACI|nr:signal peptidase I [Salibacterium halotolerans]SFQ02892.1 signal peptidase, endoplasmic reticulum-type [Salibacterium halotolerans]
MVGKMVRIALNSLLGVLFVLFLASVFLLIQGRMNPDELPSVFGYHPLTVLSNSMEPAFSAGDMILTKQTNPSDIQTGDVISFYNEEEEIITHRVVEIAGKQDEAAFVTQGDNNNVKDDTAVTGAQLIGKMQFSLPYGGHLAQFFGSPAGIILFIILPVFAYIGIEIYERLGRDKKSEQTV